MSLQFTVLIFRVQDVEFRTYRWAFMALRVNKG
jgi:hypothetical protein